MTYLLDYSAARLTGPVIKAAGYAGVIRYVGGVSTKHTTVAEYQSIKAAGLAFYAVMEVDTTDPDGGRSRGVTYAQRAKAHCDQLGYGGPVFFCNDKTTLPDPTNWHAYLDGAAAVLGTARIGAYGFRNAIDAARGHARYFWQAGRRSDLASHAHVWQDNNTQVRVAGVLCDRNLIIKPLEDDVTPEELLNFPIEREGSELGGKTTMRAVAANTDALFENTNRKIDALVTKVDKITVGGVDLDALAAKVADLISKRLAD